MNVYKVKDWGTLFENNRTRDMKNMSWVPVPNKHDGDGYTTIVSRKNGAAIYGAWMVILQVASKCEPRGTLLRSPSMPHDAASISRMTRIPEADIQLALDICTKDAQWLTVESIASSPQVTAEIPHPPAVIPHPTDEEGNGTEGNGKEQKGTPAGAFIVIPANLNVQEFVDKWEKWKEIRQGMGKKPKCWVSLFQEQIDWLSSYGPMVAISILSNSIRNNYQGLFEPKNTYGTNSNNRNAGLIGNKPLEEPRAVRVLRERALAAQKLAESAQNPVATQVALNGNHTS